MINRIYQRVSYPVHQLVLPAPEGEPLLQILQSVMSTPDHGHLRPWHLLLIPGDRVAELCALMALAWQRHDKRVTQAQAGRWQRYLSQAPLLLLVSAEIRTQTPVSYQDQLLSAAAACQNLLLAADSLGFGGIWYSTDAAEFPEIRQALGLATAHQPVGLLALGSVAERHQRPRGDVTDHLWCWQGTGQLQSWPDKVRR